MIMTLQAAQKPLAGQAAEILRCAYGAAMRRLSIGCLLSVTNSALNRVFRAIIYGLLFTAKERIVTILLTYGKREADNNSLAHRKAKSTKEMIAFSFFFVLFTSLVLFVKYFASLLINNFCLLTPSDS